MNAGILEPHLKHVVTPRVGSWKDFFTIQGLFQKKHNSPISGFELGTLPESPKILAKL
jgi:hypothetical protein